MLFAILDEVADCQDSAVGCLDLVEIVSIIAVDNLADIFDDFGHLVVLIHKCPGLAVGVWNMNKRFLGCVEHVRDCSKIIALEETISYAEAFQPLVAIELLIIVVVDGWLKPRLVLRAHHRNGIASEVRAGHGEYVGRSLVEQSANERAEAVVLVSRAVVKLVDAEENIVEFPCVYAIE